MQSAAPYYAPPQSLHAEADGNDDGNDGNRSRPPARSGNHPRAGNALGPGQLSHLKNGRSGSLDRTACCRGNSGSGWAPASRRCRSSARSGSVRPCHGCKHPPPGRCWSGGRTGQEVVVPNAPTGWAGQHGRESVGTTECLRANPCERPTLRLIRVLSGRRREI